MIVWTLALAMAGEWTPVDLAWHDFERGRYSEAVDRMVDHLDAHPEQLEAHRVSIMAQQRADYGAVSRFGPVYEQWHEAEPDSAVARYAWVYALHAKSRGEDCEQALALFEPLPQAPADQYSALRIQQSWSGCEGYDADQNAAALGALGEAGGSAAWSYGMWLASKDGDWGPVDAAFDQMVRTYPQRLSSLTPLVFAAESTAPEALRDRFVAFGLDFATEEDPIRLAARVAVLQRARHKKAKAAQKRQEELDPPGAVRTAASELQMAVYEANKKPTHELALEALRKLEKKLPDQGPERDTWLYLMATRLEATGDVEGMLAMERLKVAANPDDARTVNGWAYECAKAGEQLDEAIAAMERVLPQLDEARYPGAGPHEAWTERILRDRGSWLDTYGWLLHLKGRSEEGAAVLVEASQCLSDATILAHTGLALRAAGDDDAAWPYLVAAQIVDGGHTGEEKLDAEAHEAMVALWPSHRSWHPGGLEGWLEAQRAAAERETAEQGGQTLASADPGSDHPLIGEDFPYESADQLGGGTLDLTGHDGVLVVDLWATWCGPCVQGMPHLQEVATEYADQNVRVVGLSVDANVAAVKKFFKDVDPDAVAYELGHVGVSGMETMKVSGIPALFVVDADGKIVTYIRGYGPNDTRLERALDAVLGG